MPAAESPSPRTTHVQSKPTESARDPFVQVRNSPGFDQWTTVISRHCLQRFESSTSRSILAAGPSSGSGLADAVAASCSVPGLFPPVPLAGQRYVDGAISSPTHARPARRRGRRHRLRAGTHGRGRAEPLLVATAVGRAPARTRGGDSHSGHRGRHPPRSRYQHDRFAPCAEDLAAIGTSDSVLDTAWHTTTRGLTDTDPPHATAVCTSLD